MSRCNESVHAVNTLVPLSSARKGDGCSGGYTSSRLVHHSQPIPHSGNTITVTLCNQRHFTFIRNYEESTTKHTLSVMKGTGYSVFVSDVQWVSEVGGVLHIIVSSRRCCSVCPCVWSGQHGICVSTVVHYTCCFGGVSHGCKVR